MDAVGLKPTVLVDAGADGKIVVADSLSYFEHEPWLNVVAVGASFAGAPTAAMAMRQGVKAWIAHEGGPGKDEAGISGLPFADKFDVPAAAIATKEAGLSHGRSLLTGHVGRANQAAVALGVKPGQTGEQAARLMLKAKPAVVRDFPGLIDEAMHEVAAMANGKVYACWSFSRVAHEMPNDVFCVASHGAKIMAQYALRVRPKGLVCNDAGMGLDNSGIEGLTMLDVYKIAAAAVSTDSARIGDALSTYHDGVISAANAHAAAKGVTIGMRASAAARAMLA